MTVIVSELASAANPSRPARTDKTLRVVAALEQAARLGVYWPDLYRLSFATISQGGPFGVAKGLAFRRLRNAERHSRCSQYAASAIELRLLARSLSGANRLRS